MERAKAETTSTQFLRWRLIIEREWNQHTKLDHYLAQIAMLVYELRFILGGKSEHKLEDFFISFANKKPVPVDEPTEEEAEEIQRKLDEVRKHSLMAMFGLGLAGKKAKVGKVSKNPLPDPKATPVKGKPIPAPKSKSGHR